jgi:hypothetical protein
MKSNKVNKGFIFVFNNTIDLSKYSDENKEKYKQKILLHSLSTLRHFFPDINRQGHKIITSTETNIYQVIKDNFLINKNEIFDLNPLPIKCNDTIFYVVILKNETKQKIINRINKKLNLKTYTNPYLLFYSLESIDKVNFDMFNSIKNYYNFKSDGLNSDILFYSETSNKCVCLKLSNIIDGLCGLVDIGSKTKCYI